MASCRGSNPLPAVDISRRDERLLQAALRTLRTRAGLTQHDLARRLGRSQSYVSKIERGERRLDVAELLVICHCCGTSLDVFIREFEGLLDY